MQIRPPVAIGIIAAVVLVACLLLWQMSGSGRYPPPPPIASGIPKGVDPTSRPKDGTSAAALSAGLRSMPGGTMPGTSTMPMPGGTMPAPPSH